MMCRVHFSVESGYGLISRSAFHAARNQASGEDDCAGEHLDAPGLRLLDRNATWPHPSIGIRRCLPIR